MAKIIATLLAAVAVFTSSAPSASAYYWYDAVPHAEMFCPYVGGTLVPYTVDRVNNAGETVTLSFDGLPQSQLCTLIKEFPRP